MIIQRKIAKRMLEIKGRTLVNILGKDGNFESLANVYNYLASISIDTTNPKYGTNRLKVTISAGNTQGMGYIRRSVYAGKYYILLADVINGNATSVKVYPEADYAGNPVTSTTSYGVSYRKFTVASDVLNSPMYIQVTGAENQYGFADGFRLYEITDSLAQTFEYSTGALLYSALGTTITDNEAIGRMFPYVDSVQFKSNIFETTKGKNIVDTDASAWEQGGADLSTGVLTDSSSRIRTKNYYAINQNTTLTFSTIPGYAARCAMFFDANYNYLGYSGTTTSQYQTFTTVANCSYVKLLLTTTNLSDSIYPSDVSLIKPQLEIGSVATAWEAQQKAQFHSPIKLGDTESVYALPSGQGVYKQTWMKDVQLTGDLGWFNQGFAAGYNVVYNVSLLSFNPSSAYCTKYNGLPLTLNGAMTAIDQFAVGATGTFYLLLSTSDTGFPSSYNPSSSEIKAYLFGYKMCASDGSAYVSGTKYWKRITDGGGITSTIPNTLSPGFTPYVLHYKLANPITWYGYYGGQKIVSLIAKNKLPTNVSDWEQKRLLSVSVGENYGDATSTTNLLMKVKLVSIQGNTGYTLSVASGYEISYQAFDAFALFISGGTWGQTIVFTSPVNSATIAVSLRKTGGGTTITPADIPSIMPQLEVGGVVTAFEAQKQSIIVTGSIGQIEQRTGINQYTAADIPDKYASAVDIGTVIDNPISPTQSFVEQGISLKRKMVY